MAANPNVFANPTVTPTEWGAAQRRAGREALFRADQSEQPVGLCARVPEPHHPGGQRRDALEGDQLQLRLSDREWQRPA
jgi:hypothetical protein